MFGKLVESLVESPWLEDENDGEEGRKSKLSRR